MINFKKPEECGISSSSIERFIKTIEARRIYTHNLLIAKGDSIIYEQYWQPFNVSFLHRQYSVTKSIVALAVGFAEQDGLVNLDDPISKYFPEEAKGAKSELIRNQTIREMLTMCTALLPEHWIKAKCKDRVKFYFENASLGNKRPSGTIFSYDSTGSFILCAMVERVTGKTFMDYMREKCFDKIGVSREATCLTCPGGHSWGDSALLCTARDLFRMARFTLNYGKWEGEQLLNEEYVRTATSKLVDNNNDFVYEHNTLGYGYQIWRTYDDSFFFNGMGCQLALCCPDHDLILVYNGDNQGNPVAKDVIFNAFFDTVYKNASDTPLEEYRGAPIPEHELFFVRGSATSPMAQSIGGKRYTLEKNPMGISELCLSFGDSCGMLTYTNARGTHEIPFGIGKNACGLFPEEGYSSVVGSKPTPGHKYKMAASGAWLVPDCFLIRVQAIDEYFGNLSFMLSFKDDRIALRCMKCAENFFFDYGDGYAHGKSIK